MRLTRRGEQTYARASLPRGRTHWRQARWCSLDFELTGLDPRSDEIISFGAIPIVDGRIQLRGAVSGLVRPQREIAEPSIVIHGIRGADLAGAPALEEALPALLAAIAGAGLVVHTAAVEREFLGRAVRRVGLRLRGPIVDTEELGRLWLYERRRRTPARLALADLAHELRLPAERAHDALSDALTTAQAFIALASHLDAVRPQTVGSLARAGRQIKSLRVFETG